MHLRTHAVAGVLVVTAALAALATPAMAAPMPWETSSTPTTTAHHLLSLPAGRMVTPLCTGSCYE